MTDDGGAPLTRRAAREARRAAAHAHGHDPGADPGARTAGTAVPGEPGGARDDAVTDVAHDLPAVLSRTPAAAVVAGASAGEQPVPRRRGTGGLAQAGAEEFSLAQAVGGVRGAAETLVPGLLFVSTYTLTRDLTVSLAVSVGAAALAIVLRVVTRSAPSQALSGAVGVGVCAVFALLSGEARNFYLPGFLLNVGYGVLCLVSTVPFPRFRLPGTRRHLGPGPYPVIGLLLGPLTGEGLAWRDAPARLRAYRRVTWLWAGFFLLRLVVQVPLYLADLVGALGAARLAMGVPAFALMVWLSWALLRSVPRAVPDEHAPDHDDGRPGRSADARRQERARGQSAS